MVKAGGTVEVTERGELVALLVPPSPAMTARDHLVASGSDDLETSALVKLVFEEVESTALVRWLEERRDLPKLSSQIATIELLRTCRRDDDTPVSAARSSSTTGDWGLRLGTLASRSRRPGEAGARPTRTSPTPSGSRSPRASSGSARCGRRE